MSSELPRTTESECEQVVQQYAPTIKGAESSPVKCNNRNPPVVVFAHGSCSPSTSKWMIRWKNLLANALNAVEVVTFDYPYINGRRNAAPHPEKLVGFHSDIVRKVAAKYPKHPLILAGKSLGSKISCMVAAENDIEASAVVCLGYPLKAKNRAIRDEPLLQLTVPIMFVQGGNDIFCPLKLLEVVRNKLKVLNALHVIESADHSFQIGKKYLELTGITREKCEEFAVEAVAVFVSQITSEEVINGPRNSTDLPLRACPNGILSQHASRMVVCVENDDAVGERNNQPVKSQPKIEEFRSAYKKQQTRNVRKRKSERIIKNKLRKSVYVKDGRGSTADNPLNID